MEQHHESCIACAMLVADLDGIVESARSLPVLTPSRDLWSGIEARLEAPVIPLVSRRDALAAAPRSRRSGISVRWFAMAATMLVAVSSGVTWTVARARFSVPASAAVVASGSTSGTTSAGPAAASPISSPSPSSTDAPAPVSATASSSDAPATGESRTALASTGRSADGARSGGSASSRVTLVRAGSMSDVDAIYEREIAALRRIVDQRFAELDSATVAELRRNLETIDQAIADSRRALERDPRSGLLSTELDRTLEAKLALMRRVALL